MEIKRGSIFLYNFGKHDGHIQGGTRAAVIVSNNLGNKFSRIVLVSPITGQIDGKASMPTHVIVDHESSGLLKDSQILCEQIFPVNKDKLGKYIGELNLTDLEKLNKALEISIQVGKEGKSLNNGLMKEIDEYISDIEQLDIVIEQWLDKKKSVDLIFDFIEERKVRIEELKQYCENIGVNYTDFYKKKIQYTA